MTELRRRMTQDLKLRNVSENTIVCYIRAIRQYAEYLGKSSDQLKSDRVRKYLLYLLEERCTRMSVKQRFAKRVAHLIELPSRRLRWIKQWPIRYVRFESLKLYSMR